MVVFLSTEPKIALKKMINSYKLVVSSNFDGSKWGLIFYLFLFLNSGLRIPSLIVPLTAGL